MSARHLADKAEKAHVADEGAQTSAVPPPVDSACRGAESFALRVLGEDMAPEFHEGEIIIVEPGGAVKDGSYVLAQVDGEWTLRQLRRDGEAWWLRATNPACTHQRATRLADLGAVRGVVIQKAVPGRRRLTRFYV